MGLEDRVKQGADRRKHLRCSIEGARAVYCTGVLAFVNLGKSKAGVYNLSEEGVCIQTEGRLKPGTKVRVEIAISRPKELFEAYGIVKRSVERQSDHKVYTGIEFTELNSVTKSKLKAMCDYFNSPTYKNLRKERPNNPLNSLEY
jgi:c-di-GMP-binding flagellar brake protein YcgR